VALLPIRKLPLLLEEGAKRNFKAFEVPRNYNRKTEKKQIIVTWK